MKKMYSFSIALLTLTVSSLNVKAQDAVCDIPGATLCDNFDSYTDGDALGPDASWWSTWSGTEGGAEDAEITDDFSYSEPLSMTIEEGGINDVILKLGNQSSGNWRLAWQMYVPNGKTGYFNIQEDETPGLGWNLEVLFGLSAIGVPSSSGEGTMSIPTLDDFTYPVDEWFYIDMLIDLDADVFEIYIAGIMVSTGAYTGNIGSIDFYSVDANCRYYIDNVLFTNVMETTCVAPTGVTVYGITSTSATVSWNAVTGAEKYKLMMTDNTTGQRNTRQFDVTAYVFSHLTPGHSYTFSVKTVCDPEANSSPSEFIYFTAPLRIGTELDNSMTIYPNPGDGNLYLRGWSAENNSAYLMITDITGAVVLQMNLDVQQQMDPLPLQLDVPAGMYILHVQGNNNAYRETIVVE